jgi:hypothetical protein
MKRIRFLRRTPVRLLVAFLGLISLAGCGSTAAPTAADPDAAKKTLEQALTSWQKGETLEAVKKANPSIDVSDQKWSKGAKLTKFEVQLPSKPSGAQQKFRVNLWLTDAKGQEKQEVAQYEVGTSPINTVVRSMFE